MAFAFFFECMTPSRRFFTAPLKVTLSAAVLLGLGGSLPAASKASAAPLCSRVFVSSAKTPGGRNAEYFRSSLWGQDLPDQLRAWPGKEYILTENDPAKKRTEVLKGFLLRDLIVAPGHRVLRVSSSPPSTKPAPGSQRVLLNAITSQTGHLRFLDIWDGHHRILEAFRQGADTVKSLEERGFFVDILINGKPAGSSSAWKHILPAAATNPSWESRARILSEKNVEVSGEWSNYELGSRTTLYQLVENEAQARQLKLGIFFGTFDPVDENHIAVAKMGLSEFGLDKVILIPNARPQHKKPSLLGYRQALLMERIKNEPGLDTVLFDTHYFIEHFGKNTLVEKIRQDLGSNQIFLIDGRDSFQKLMDLNQIQPTDVIHYIVSKRGDDITVPARLQKKVFLSQKDFIEVSSSEILQSFSEGKTPEEIKFSRKSTEQVRAWGLYESGRPRLYSSEDLYNFMKASHPLSDLRFKGGEASSGLTFHHNDVWQMLLPGDKKGTYQVAFFKPDTPESRRGKNRVEAEEAAFLLNRLLKMDLVPPTVVVENVKAGGREYARGALSFAVSGAEKLLTAAHLDSSLEQQLFFSDARVLNVLLHNKDANDRNFLIGRHWSTGKTAPFLIDFSQSFAKDQYLSMTYYPLGHKGEIKVFRKSTLAGLKSLTAPLLREHLSHLLSEQDINDILERRNGIVAYIERLQQSHQDTPILY